MAKSERSEALVFLVPLILVIIVFILLGVLVTIADSFFRDVTYLPEKFVGFGNYAVLFGDRAFWQSISFTFLFVLVSVPL